MIIIYPSRNSANIAENMRKSCGWYSKQLTQIIQVWLWKCDSCKIYLRKSFTFCLCYDIMKLYFLLIINFFLNANRCWHYLMGQNFPQQAIFSALGIYFKLTISNSRYANTCWNQVSLRSPWCSHDRPGTCWHAENVRNIFWSSFHRRSWPKYFCHITNFSRILYIFSWLPRVKGV